jgi:hypothetical protein
MSTNYVSTNYYPPFRVDSSVPDDIIRQSWMGLIEEEDIIGKIEDNGVFKTVYFNEDADLDTMEDTLWVFLKRLEREGFLMIFKDENYQGSWFVDGFSTDPTETYQLNDLYKVTYLDKNVKGIRVSEWKGTFTIFMDDHYQGYGWLVDGTYQLNALSKVAYLDKNEKGIRVIEWEEDIDERPIVYHFEKTKPTVEATIEPIVETKPKKRFFQKFVRMLGFR